MNSKTKYILRTFDLAELGKQFTSPNPYVGAVLVSNDQIIGEGYTSTYGSNHAEVNALQSVEKNNICKISTSTLFVSLEPCSIHGRTPPCTDLIIEKKIPNIVYSALDKTENVYSQSEKILSSQNRNVDFGVLNELGNELVKIRNTFVSKKRPYIILKYAQSIDGYIGVQNQAVWLTNSFSKSLVHKWRSEVDAILVGTNTAIVDNPNLTNRLYFGKNPLRIALDRKGRIQAKSNLYNNEAETWIFTEQDQSHSSVEFIKTEFDEKLIPKILDKLYQSKKSSLIVEGGAQLLNSFIKMNLWDEARVFIAPKTLGSGIAAPKIPIEPSKSVKIIDDQLLIYRNYQS